jgi:hypothetical protein
MKTGAKVLFSVAAVLTAAAAAAQNLALELRAPFGQYVAGEQIVLNFRMVNRGPAPVVIDDYPPYSENRLLVEVWGADRYSPIKPSREGSLVAELMLAPENVFEQSIDLLAWYAPFPQGRFYARVVLLHNDRRYESDRRSFDVVPGLELAQVLAAPADQPLRERVYRLSYLARGGQEQLFLQCHDREEGAPWSALPLGPIVRVNPPSLSAAADSVLIVRHQASRDDHLTTRVRIGSDSMEILDRKTQRDTSTTPLIRALSGTAAGEPKKGEPKKGAPAATKPTPAPGPAAPDAPPPKPAPPPFTAPGW